MPVGTLGPFALPAANAVGTQVTILPSGQFGDPNALGDVLINNFSGYLLGVTSSGSGELLNLPPASANVYPAPSGGGSLVVTVLSGSAGSAHPSVSAQVGLMGETFRGAYPQSLPGVSTGPAATLLGIIPAGDGYVDVTPDPSATAILATTSTVDVALSYSLTGQSSSIQISSMPFNAQEAIAPLPLGDEDESYTVSLSTTFPNDVYVWQLSGQPVIAVANLPIARLSGVWAGLVNAGPHVIGDVSVTGGPGTASIPLTPGVTAIVIYAPGSTQPPYVEDSNSVYSPVYEASPGIYVAPFVAVASGATSVTVGFYASAAQVYQYQEVPFVPRQGPVVSINVPNPAAGANWSYTLPFNARVAHIGAVFVTSSTAADRYPYMNFLSLGGGNAFDGLPAGSPMTAGAAYNLSWQAGAGFVPYLSQGAYLWTAAIPDYGVLPAGTVIESGVSGLQAADQWSAINLQLAPA